MHTRSDSPRLYRVEIEKSGRWITVEWARAVHRLDAAAVIADLASKGERARMVRL